MTIFLSELKRGILAALMLVMMPLGTLTACSTTDEEQSHPWQETMMNDICAQAQTGTPDCSQ